MSRKIDRFIRSYVSVHVYYACILIHTHTHTTTNAQTQTQTHTCAHAHTHTHTLTLTLTLTHTHTHTHTHTISDRTGSKHVILYSYMMNVYPRTYVPHIIFNGAQKAIYSTRSRSGSVCLLTNIQLYPKPRYLIVLYCMY